MANNTANRQSFMFKDKSVGQMVSHYLACQFACEECKLLVIANLSRRSNTIRRKS